MKHKSLAVKETIKFLRRYEPIEVLGVGCGSTVKLFLEEMIKEGLRVKNIVTASYDTSLKLNELGLRNYETGMGREVDIYIDSADEVDKDLNMIKGRGGALTREKVLASLSKLRIFIITEEKLVSKLGTTKPVPIEVVPYALNLVIKELRRLGFKYEVRMSCNKDGLEISDNYGFLINVFTGSIDNPLKLHETLKNIPGVVETGIFVGFVDVLVVGFKDGRVSIITKGGIT